MGYPLFTTGDVLNASDMNAVGLWLVKTDTITSGSSKEITSVFSSNYRDYLIVIDNFVASAGVGLSLRIGTNALNYYWGGITVNYATNAVVGENGNNTTSFNTGAVADTTGAAGTTVNVLRPFLTTRTNYNASGIDSRTGGAGCRNYSGFLNDTTSYTSFTLLIAGATFTSCNVAVYGYKS